MDQPSIITPATVGKDFVSSKCSYFTDVQLWPISTHLDPEGWLTNFVDSEMEHAVHLLSGFLFYSNALVSELFRSAFQRLSRSITDPAQPYVRTEAVWKSFRQNVLITYVTGEQPNPTDSGLLFARRARQDLEIPQSQIMAPELVLERLISHGPRPVVFVDDFVGTGEQFVATWHREYSLSKGREVSFAAYSNMRGSSFYYCPVICTTKGRDTILNNCNRLNLRPAHELGEEYSVFDERSLFWPEHLRPTARAFIHDASNRAGIA